MTGKTFIILVNYNNHDDTLKCLGSIAKAGYGNNVVVVDNKSTAPGLDNIKIQFPDTILIKNDENIGFGRANNIGIQWALKNTNCEYVFILNNDTTINETTISMLEMTLSGNENIAIATPKIVMMDNPDVLWYSGGEVNWTKCSATIPGYIGQATNKDACISKYVLVASGCAMLVRRKVIENLDAFDKHFLMYVEMYIRIVKSEMRILYTSNTIVCHKEKRCQRSDKTFYPILQIRHHPLQPTPHVFSSANIIYNLFIKLSFMQSKSFQCNNCYLNHFRFQEIPQKAKIQFNFPINILSGCLSTFSTFYKRFDATKVIIKVAISKCLTPIIVTIQTIREIPVRVNVFIITMKYLLVYSVIKLFHGSFYFGFAGYTIPLFILWVNVKLQERASVR